MAGTSLQVEPLDALQQALQVAWAAVLPIAPQVNFQVATAFDPKTTTQDAVEFAARIAPETGSRTTFRTTLGTVPGTVPTVAPGMSILACLVASNTSSFGHLGRFLHGLRCQVQLRFHFEAFLARKTPCWDVRDCPRVQCGTRFFTFGYLAHDTLCDTRRPDSLQSK